MAVARVTEIISGSKKSFQDAVDKGIARANKTLKNVEGAWIKDQSIVLDKGENADNEHGIAVHTVTASSDLALDWQDSAEMIVEPVPMPEMLIGLVRDFCEAHFDDTSFVKRKRDKKRVDLVEDGIGDARIKQVADVYRSPASLKARRDE